MSRKHAPHHHRGRPAVAGSSIWTEEIPKTLVPVMGRPILEWVLEALAAGGFTRKDVIFICGYRAEVIRARYPEFTYVENRDWEQNNILLSLLTARDIEGRFRVDLRRHRLSGRYRERSLRLAARQSSRLRHRLAAPLRRTYAPPRNRRRENARGGGTDRRALAHHPFRSSGGRIRGGRQVHEQGAAELLEAFDGARERFAGQVFREKRTFERAYLIDLFQDMIEKGSTFHRVDTHGGYMEIDTLQDESMASAWWTPKRE